MKLKYFLRGVGVGIIFGALVMLVAYFTSGASKLSDKEIIERAENLGMVKAEDMVITNSKEDDNTVVDTTEANNKVDEPAQVTTAEGETTENKADDTTATTTQSEIIQGTDVSLEGVVDESISATTEETPDSTYVTAKITVTSGMSSYDVALMLQNAGIIDDCDEFDSYLNENGYSTQIRINDYEFNSNMTYEELAKALIKEDKQ